MNKHTSRKLVLSRETLMPLTAEALEDVNGGGTVGTVAASVRATVAATAAASARYCSAVVNGAKYVADKAVNFTVAASAKIVTDRVAGGGGGGGNQ